MPRTRKSNIPPTSTPSAHNPPTSFSPSIPAHWPSHLTYLVRPIYSPSLTPLELSTLHTPTPNQSLSSSASSSPSPVPAIGPHPHISIQPITFPPTHPALNQHGLFATQPLPPGSWICDYMGYIHPSRTPNFPPALYHTANNSVAGADVNKDAAIDTASLDHSCSDSDPKTLQIDMDAAAASSDYDLSLHRELGVGIDASTCGNEARFINDYRGIRATPNARFEEHWVRLPLSRGPPRESWPRDVGGDAKRWKWELRMGVCVLGIRRDGKGGGKRGILAGDEIVVSYGKGFWRERRAEILGDYQDRGMPTSEYGELIKNEERT